MVWTLSGDASQVIRLPYEDDNRSHVVPPKLIDGDQDVGSDLRLFIDRDDANLRFGQFCDDPEFSKFHDVGPVSRRYIARRDVHLRCGNIGAAPDLTVQRSVRDVAVLPENGTGPSRFGHIMVNNVGFTHAVHYSYDLPDPSAADDVSQAIDNTFVRGLTVRDTAFGQVVFDQLYDAAMAHDRISDLNFSDTARL